MSAYLLIISSKAPYHSSNAIDAFEAALAATNVGLEVKYLFQHDGVFQLVKEQASEAIFHKNTFKKLSALPLFDVEEIYACKKSIDDRALDLSSTGIDWTALQTDEMIQLIHSAKQILVF